MAETESPNAMTPSSPEDAALRAQIDRSLRLPVLFFFTSGMIWLLVSMVLGLLASIKSHSPDAFADCAWLTYGRLQPAHMDSLIYGWGMQVGLGAALWIMARLARVPLKKSLLLIVAGHFWNAAVLLGVLGVLGGFGTSMEFLDFPAFTWPILFLSYVIIAGHIVVLFKARRPGQHIFISQWYILAACFWFPWIFLTANLFLNHFHSAAVVGAAISAWYANTLLILWFVPIGLGASYYLIPKIVGRPISSYQHAMISFWGLALLGGWVGLQQFLGGPLPSWMPAISGAAMVFLAIPMIAIGVNHHKTVQGSHYLIQHSPTLRFVFFGAIAFNVFILIGALSTLFSGVFQFTHAHLGYQLTGLYAFFTMLMFGAIYFIMPRLMNCEWRSGGWIRFHFWFSAYGSIALVVCLFVGGLYQGEQAASYLARYEISYEVSRAFLVGRSLAWGFLILSNVSFFLHLLLMALRLGKRSGEATLIHPLDHSHVGKTTAVQA